METQFNLMENGKTKTLLNGGEIGTISTFLQGPQALLSKREVWSKKYKES